MDISIIEFVFYGIIGYSGTVMIISSAFRNIPDTKAHSIARVVWVIPSIGAIFVLAGSGVGINFDSPATVVTEVYNGTGSLISNSTSYSTQPSQITLVNPMWILFHSMLGLIMMVYVFTQIINLFGKKE